ALARFVAYGSGTIQFNGTAVPQPALTGITAGVLPITIRFSVLPQIRLGHWRFNGGWRGEEGQNPLIAQNIDNVQNWNHGALRLDTSGPAKLVYGAFDPDMFPNIR